MITIMNDLFSSMDYNWKSVLKVSVLFLGSAVLLLFLSKKTPFNWMGTSFRFINSKVVSSLFSGGSKTLSGLNLVLLGLFTKMLLLKLWGLVPYVYSLTAQMSFTLGLSLVMWLAMNWSKMKYDLVGSFSHYTPLAAPLYLVPLLKLMELVSKIIRFFTLSLRLSMNMSTGHILLTLLSMSFSSLALSGGLPLSMIVAFIGSGYLMFELMVSFMQGYVFSLLVSQYSNEHK